MRLKDHLPDEIRARLFPCSQDNGDIVARCALYKRLMVSICVDNREIETSSEQKKFLRGRVVLSSTEARNLLKDALDVPGLNIFVCDADWREEYIMIRGHSIVMHIVTPLQFS